MKTPGKPSGNIMRKYYQLILVIACFVSIVTLLIYRHEYYRLRYVLEVLNFFGKPGLSEIEFCGPGFNATMLTEILRNSSMEVRETPPLFQQIDDNFYAYSSFLRSYQKYEKLTPTHAHNIDTIVIGRANARPNFRCNVWLENSSKHKVGVFSFKTVSEPVNDFRLFIFQCSLNQNMGKLKGISFYANDYKISPIHAPISRLIEVNTKRRSARPMSNIQFMSNVVPAMCIIPNQVPIVSRDALIESLVFHHLMGVNSFTIYDSMISEDVIRRLNLVPTDITQWEIQFFPLNFPFNFAKSYDIVKQAIELDCLFRHYRLDKGDDVNRPSHAMVISWDEFLVPRVHNDMKAVIADFDPTHKHKSIVVEPLLFCLNQNDDDNSEAGYPDIMKKTHYYHLPQEKKRPIYIRNLDAMSHFEDIFNITRGEAMPLNLLAVHKYTECRDPKSYHPRGVGYNETQMEVFRNKYEAAMTKFGSRLVSDKIYRLYTSGQIWEKPGNDEVREML